MDKKNQKLIKIGEKIRKLREKDNYSQEEFARKAGLDRSYYGGIERGERNISTINLIKIAEAFDLEVGELFPPMELLKKE